MLGMSRRNRSTRTLRVKARRERYGSSWCGITQMPGDGRQAVVLSHAICTAFLHASFAVFREIAYSCGLAWAGKLCCVFPERRATIRPLIFISQVGMSPPCESVLSARRTSGGGGEQLLASLIEGIAKAGHDVSLAAGLWQLRRWLISNRFDVVVLNDPHASVEIGEFPLGKNKRTNR